MSDDPKDFSAGGAAQPKRTLVEEGTRFKGSLSSSCPIMVQGSVDGEIEGPALTISATGVVSGTIVAGALKSAGAIAGDFEVDTAQVAGTVGQNTVIRAASLHLKLTAPNGKLELTFGGGSARGPRGAS